MFRLMHWLTCKHRDVHRLRWPSSLQWSPYVTPLGRRLMKGYEPSFAPTPGPKDATIG